MFEKLKKLLGDNAEALEELKAVETSYTGLDSSNKELVTKLEGAQRDMLDSSKRRDNALERTQSVEKELETLKATATTNEEFEKQFKELTDKHQQEVDLLKAENGTLKTSEIEYKTLSEVDRLNLSALLPEGGTDIARANNLKHLKNDVLEGSEYDSESKTLVYKKDGVIRLSSDTGKPLTVDERVAELKTTVWETKVNSTPNPIGPGRGNTDGGSSAPSGIEVKKGNANALMTEAFENK